MAEKLFDTLQVLHAPTRAVINNDHLPIYHMETTDLNHFSLTAYSFEGRLNQERGGGWFEVRPTRHTHIYMLSENQTLQGEASWGSGWILGFQPNQGKIIQKIRCGDGQQFTFEGRGSAFCLLSAQAEPLAFQFLTQPRINLLAVSGIWNSHDLKHIDEQTRLELDDFIAHHVK